MSSELHVVVVERDESWQDDLSYAIECPGVTDDCRMWSECRACESLPPEQSDALYEDDYAHGEEHRHLAGVWMVATARCLVRNHEGWLDACWELDLKEPGRYPIEASFEDDGEYVTFELAPS